MILPHAKDCEQIEHYVSDFLALAAGLALAYPDPGFRPFMEPERQEILDACRLMDVLAAPDRAAIRQGLVQRREAAMRVNAALLDRA